MLDILLSWVNLLTTLDFRADSNLVVFIFLNKIKHNFESNTLYLLDNLKMKSVIRVLTYDLR